MSNNKCSCGNNHDENKKCGCNHDHNHDDNCNCEEEEEGFGTVEYEDENGQIQEYPIVDCFSVDGVEYVLIQDTENDSVFMLKVQDDELVNPTQEEFDRVTKIYYESEE